jgi:transcriptional regulator GlxA family with amidase domain
VPGGSGIVDALVDPPLTDFVRRQGSRARYITSVCIGAFVLGAAALLDGRRATSHWAYVDLLPLVGARYEEARVVRDGPVITAAGVASGLDFDAASRCAASVRALRLVTMSTRPADEPAIARVEHLDIGDRQG